MTPLDRARARRIVKLAAERTPAGRAWLLEDREGSWERTALDYLTRAAENPAAATMTADAVDGEIADVLALLAVEALLREARRALRGAP